MAKVSLHFDILTLFPDFFNSLPSYSLICKTLKSGLVEMEVHDIRDFGKGAHRQVDDRPFGGGPGMVLKADVLHDCLKNTINLGYKKRRGRKPHIVLLDPAGETFKQEKAVQLSKKDWLILICGHYEGIDERFKKFVAEEISIGDYVLGGGETAALVIVDAVSRLVPGFLGKKESAISESFSKVPIKCGQTQLLDYPAYTRPESFLGKKVPKILLSGDHQKISKWRTVKRIEKTREKRPDLLK
jgi:tRNA (guanine37-N1)-methyltransferase